MSPTQTHDFRSVLQGVFVLHAVVSFAGAWPRSCCGEQSVLPRLLGAPHIAVSMWCCFVASLHTKQDLYMCMWHTTPPGSRLRWTRDGTRTGDTSNFSAGLNSHFSPTLSFAFSRANSLGQCSFTADCSCIWKLPSPIWVKRKN